MSLNDPQWGRGGGSNGSNDGGRDGERRPQRQDNDGPPDLDELWRDFNRRLNSMFGRRGGGGRSGGGGLGGLRPNGRGAGVGLTAVLAVVALIWLGSGFYIVPEYFKATTHFTTKNDVEYCQVWQLLRKTMDCLLPICILGNTVSISV